MPDMPSIRLTQYSHGAGCGCKIAPNVLASIIQQSEISGGFDNLLVGHHTSDDAAVMDLGNGQSLISTTDFFMPIVDDPFEFGQIAATNAISDVYAMGGTPILAIAILGWPVDKLDPAIAKMVLNGGRQACLDAGIPIGGGHSIDNPEPLFGLAVNGLVPTRNIKRNSTAKPGDLLFLTKPLGIGMLTTAEKRGILKPEHEGLAAAAMKELNVIGQELGNHDWVHAITDVTGFGLLGHLSEMIMASEVHAIIEPSAVQYVADMNYYLEQKSSPGGTKRNYESFQTCVGDLNAEQRSLLFDPQTSGGLLVAVHPDHESDMITLLKQFNRHQHLRPIGRLTDVTPSTPIRLT